MAQAVQKHTYRVKLAEDGRGTARDIEFEAYGADAALHLLQRVCGHRPVELFEDGRKLASLEHSCRHGFWMVSN